MPTSQPETVSLIVSVGVQCNVGKERTENQDRVSRAATPFGDLFVVADGVGGYQGGSEAAQATVDGFVRCLNSSGDLPLSQALQEAMGRITADLQQRSAANPALHGMGSTVVLCVINGTRATYAHVGDSRLYHLRDRKLIQLTRDHSVMERMVSQGILTPAQAKDHPDSSVLTRAIGQASDVALDVAEITLQPNDGLLLCSDGLWGYARHQEMEAIAASESLSASGVATALLNLALEGGGGDNVSIQFLRFHAADSPVKSASLLGMPRKSAVPLVALATVLALATLAMGVWNFRHPLSTKVSEATPGDVPTAPVPLPEKPKPVAADPQLSKTNHSTAGEPNPTPVTGVGSTVPVNNAHAKTSVIIIQGDSSDAEWENLRKLNYLQTSFQRGSDNCLAMAQATSTLLYTSKAIAVAHRIRKDLGATAPLLAETSPGELKECGGGEIVAMPSKPSLAERVKSGVQSGLDKARTGVQKGVKTVKKKAQEVERKSQPPN